MDEGSHTKQDIPEFITDTLKQLISLKSNMALIDDFINDMKELNSSISTDNTDFANKIKVFLNSFKVKVTDINSTFIDSYDAFIKENGVESSKTSKVNTESEHRKSDSGGGSKQTYEPDICADNIVENSDSDVPLVKNKRTRKSSKENSKISDTDTSLEIETSTRRKKRRRKKSSKSIQENDNSDSEHSKTSDKSRSKYSSIRNTISEETIESENTATVKSKPELNEKEVKTKTNNDSDKENSKNANSTSKDIKEKDKPKTPVEYNNSSDVDSEKESFEEATTGKSKKDVVVSDSDSSLIITKSKTKDIINKKHKKSKIDSDLDTDKETSENTTEKESKKVVDSDSDTSLSTRKSRAKDTKNKKNKKSKLDNNLESEKEKSGKNRKDLKKVVESESDTSLNITKSGNKNTKKKKTKNSKTGIDSDSRAEKIKAHTTKETVSESDTDLDKNKSKTKEIIVDETDSDNKQSKKDDESSDTSSSARKAKDTISKKDIISKLDSDLESEKEKSGKNRKDLKKTVESGSDSSLNITKSGNKDKKKKKTKNSKTSINSNSRAEKTKADKTKDIVSESDTDLDKNKSKTKENMIVNETDSDNKQSKKDDEGSDTSLSAKDTICKKNTKSKLDSDLESEKQTSGKNRKELTKGVESSRNKKIKNKDSKQSKKDIESDSEGEKVEESKDNKTKEDLSDSDSAIEKRKSKTKEHKIVDETVSDNTETEKTTADSKKVDAAEGSDASVSSRTKSKLNSDLDSDKETSDKNRKKLEKVIESVGDTSLKMKKSRNKDTKNKKTRKSKVDSESDSEADKTKKDTESDSQIEKNKSKTEEHKTVDEINTDNIESEKITIYTKKNDSEDKDKRDKESNLSNDSDPYIEDPRIIIEKSKKTLEEKRKSSKLNKSNDSENLETNNDNTSEKNVSDKNKPDLCNSSNKTVSNNDEKKNDSDIPDTTITADSKTTLNNQDENSVKDKENLLNGEVTEEHDIEEKPKFGLIKCIDITKLLDPKVTSVENPPSKMNNSIIILTSSESETDSKPNKSKSAERKNTQKAEKNKKSVENKKTDEKSTENKKKQKVVSIDSSDSSEDKHKKSENKKKEENLLENKKKQNVEVETIDSNNSSDDLKTKDKHKKSENKKKDEKSDKKSVENKKKRNVEIETIESDDSSDDGKRRSRFNKKRATLSTDIAKKSFEQFRNLRARRAAATKKPIIDKNSSSSSDNDSESSNSSHTSQKASKHIKKRQKTEKSETKIDPNYDYKKDIKFELECCISLPRIPVEQLKTKYLEDKEDVAINRLTNMKTLKRTRQQKSTPSSSDNDAKTVKKRSKLHQQQQKQRKKTSDDEEQSEHSINNDSIWSGDESITKLDTGKKDVKIPIPDDLLDSDGDSNKHSDSSDNEDKDKNKKKSKNSDKKKNDKEKETDDTEENDKDNEKGKKEDKEKSKWRNDSLLKGKLSASDSEDELIRFRNKKNKIEDDIRSEHEEETLVPKKRDTKKYIKRIARRLGSDVSSSEDEKEESKKSDKENSNSETNSSSDSEEEEKSKKRPARRRIKRIKTSDESSEGEQAKRDRKKKKEEEELSTRKKIRHVWSKDSLADSTKEAAKEEEERKKRISDRQKLYNEIYDNKLDSNAKVDKVILDFNEETKKELLSVHPGLVEKLKPHQAKGVQFMWNSCFESLERAQNTEGSGCILAHCMGLGKTLQVITLIHTLLINAKKTKVKTVLVVCPLSTVLNWVAEFKKWLDDLDGEQVNVFDLVQYKQNYERLYQMQDWMKFGGVMIMGYDMFRNLSNPKGKRMSKKLIVGFNKVLLEPGPDLVVCDEGHLLKNEKTGISIAMNKLKTMRRVVLTGTPLQNNLKEYFCMVQFVKPNLLGTYKEYLNRFVNPITNGQYTDSTPHDIQIMRKRAHVLHKMLDAVVERRDYNVLAPFLPPKHEYVLFVSLAEVQIKLYREYLSKFSRNTNVKGTSYLFQDFQELQRICIHPRVLLDKSNQDKLRKEMDDDDSEGSLKDFIDDDESEKSSTGNESSSESESGSEKKPNVATRRTRANPGNLEEEPLQQEITSHDTWWSKFCQGDELDNICHSSKIKLLFDILHHCELIGDKVLVFSQSLYSLNLIEYFLGKVDEATQSGDTESLAKVGGHTGSWALGLDYFRMDGSTSCDNRALWCKSFNNEANTRARLFLISTRAGGLGINLVAANRVIIFDVSWNPSFDIQSIYRVYRFGQTKPCYIYRFVTLGTMENKIYERQVTKQAISKRVIDEQQIDRHYNQTDLAELYAFIPVPDEERPIPLVPKDRLFADLLQTHDKQIFKYHEHNSLLEDKADEGLNEEERKAAWEEFENEKKAPKFNLMQTMVRNGTFETLRILVQEDNSGWTPAQINNVLPAVVQRMSEQVARGDYSMYRRVEERHEMRVMEQRRMQMIYTQYMQQLRTASGGANMTPADMNKLAQMFSAYNQTLAAQQAMQPRPQMPGSSAAVSFNQGDPPPQTTPAPTPHPAVSEVVELID